MISPTHIEVTTTSDLGYKYTYYPLPPHLHTLNVKVKAICNAFIVLSKEAVPERCDPVLEIFLGVENNKRSYVRRDKKLPNKAVVDTPNILSSAEHRGFWINFEGGMIQVGKDGEANPFMSWIDEFPFPITYFGVKTGFGVEGEWIVNDETIKTCGNNTFIFRPVRRFHLDFTVQAPQNALVAFTSGMHDTRPMYEIGIGGWGNQQSAIRYLKNNNRIMTYVETPGILSAAEPRRFQVSCNHGLVRVTRGDCEILMQWQDENPFNVTHFGVQTSNGSTGHWVIDVCNDIVQAKRELEWVPMINQYKDPLLPKAVPGGEGYYAMEYVGRIRLSTTDPTKKGIIPGDLTLGHWWYISYTDKDELYTYQYHFDMLTGEGFHWVNFDGTIPPNAVVGGCHEDGEVLYIGRSDGYAGKFVIGKIQSSDMVLVVTYGYEEIVKKFATNYQILVQN